MAMRFWLFLSSHHRFGKKLAVASLPLASGDWSLAQKKASSKPRYLTGNLRV
jgi:hypothetical protein